MTRKDVDGLFELLGIFRKGDQRVGDMKLRSAWYMVLAPYQKEDVRKAVSVWFRNSSFWPDPSDIAQLCPPLPGQTVGRPPGFPQEYKAILNRWDRLVKQRREAGIPATEREAQEKGLSRKEYFHLLEKYGMLWE